MANVYGSPRPPYPVYDRTPVYGGELPQTQFKYPPDLRPSELNPFYTQYRGTRGRNFAGLGEMESQLSADEGIRDYPNELNLLNAADDVQGNGLFDPHGTQGNVHTEYGVFADHVNMPGYLVREQFWRPGEIIDATAEDGNVMYVPSGAVAIDAASRTALERRRGLWDIPPGVAPVEPRDTPFQPTWNHPPNQAWPVHGAGAIVRDAEDDAEETRTGAGLGKILVAFGIAGVAVGIFVATTRAPKKRRNRR